MDGGEYARKFPIAHQFTEGHIPRWVEPKQSLACIKKTVACKQAAGKFGLDSSAPIGLR